ncbi:MAG TPA: COR domain-containing protein [Candidatus Hydrogenedentes bacterium]|nr:COR domain-containing protein [Candidatus Hydrogenedentota bacterium]
MLIRVRRVEKRVEAPVCTLNEAKILVVGEPGVGKTALIHWLTKKRLLPNPECTHGIKIAEWSVPSQSKDDPPIRVNVWDFGGQEIMQATHQFFLTERSLYLLVLDSRENEEQSKLRYWMDKIRAFGGDSPVIVVLNKRDEGGFEPDETRLRKDYAANLLDPFFRTVCNDKTNRTRCGEGIDKLRAAIFQRVRQLDNVRQPVPSSYLKAKVALKEAAGKRKNLARKEYDSLCKKYRLKPADRSSLLAYLKQLGTLFHYESPGGYGPLPETYVLDPTWVTKGVYAILTDLEVRNRFGELEPADLPRIFRGKKSYPRDHQQFILAMMEDELFELCFPVPNPPPGRTGLRLIPELLPPQEPDHGIEPAMPRKPEKPPKPELQ